MNSDFPTHQLPRVCALSALLVIILTLAFAGRKPKADTIHTIGNNGPVQVLLVSRDF